MRILYFVYSRILGWRRISKVRLSVIGRQTFPALRPIYGWHVAKLWVNYQLCVSQLGQLSHLSFQGRSMSSDPCNYMDYGGGDHKTADCCAYKVVQKRIPSFIFEITSVIQHRFEPFFHYYKQKFMARKRDVLPPTTLLLCDHWPHYLSKQTLLLISVLSVLFY